jgi:hypothetical protein
MENIQMNRRSAMLCGLGVLFAPRAALARLERRERVVEKYAMFKGWMWAAMNEVQIQKEQEKFFRNGVFPRFSVKIGEPK